MTNISKTVDLIRGRVHERPTATIGDIARMIVPITIGLMQPMLVADKGKRLFRVRALASKPTHVDQVGAPPNGSRSRGRINERGTSVLYLSDTPYTALKEAGISEGECCLSEWRVECKKLGLINGGLTQEFLEERVTMHFPDGREPTEQDQLVMSLYRDLFTLDVGDDTDRYAWSIGAAQASGFSHQSDLIKQETIDGWTRWKGKTPFSALVYPSVRTDKLSLNYVVNHQGMQHISLENVQWIRLRPRGRLNGLDIAKTWSDDGQLEWEGRPAKFHLKSGESAKLTKVGENEWDYDTADGSLPWYD